MLFSQLKSFPTEDLITQQTENYITFGNECAIATSELQNM